jgi:hypothetical protein
MDAALGSHAKEQASPERAKYVSDKPANDAPNIPPFQG